MPFQRILTWQKMSFWGLLLLGALALMACESPCESGINAIGATCEADVSGIHLVRNDCTSDNVCTASFSCTKNSKCIGDQFNWFHNDSILSCEETECSIAIPPERAVFEQKVVVTTKLNPSGTLSWTGGKVTKDSKTFKFYPKTNTIPTANPRRLIGGAIQGVRLNLVGNVTTFAGVSGTPGSLDGQGSNARLAGPFGVTTDGTHLYIADEVDHTIRKIVISTAQVSTIAGSATINGLTNGVGTNARFSSPRGITTDGTNLYIADSGNNQIRKIVISTATVTTLAGQALSGSNDGVGGAARFNAPSALTTDGTYLYVADSGNHTLRKVAIDTGTVTTLAGQPGASGSLDGVGNVARFSNPQAMIYVSGGFLYIADPGNNAIRQVNIGAASVSTIAGGGIAGTSDGVGTQARFSGPSGITSDGFNLYITDLNSHLLRQLKLENANVTTLAGDANVFGTADGVGNSANFNQPRHLTTDGSSLFLGDFSNSSIRRVQ